MSKPNETIASLPVDTLKNVAREKLQQLNEHQKRFERFKSDLDLLKTRYNLRQSLIDTAAQWYGQKTLWQKIILTAEVVGVALVASLLFNTLALLAIVSTYIALIYLFNNHNARDSKREQDICENIIKIEQNLSDSIQSFNAMEAKLVEVFNAIFQKNEALTSYTADLDDKLAALNEQVLSLQKAITGLAEVQKALDASQALVQSSGAQFGLTVDDLGKDVLRCTATIGAVTEELAKRPDNHTALTVIKDDLSHCEVSLLQLTEALKKQVQIAEEQANQCDAMQLRVDTVLSGSSSATELLDEQFKLCDEDDDEINRVLNRSKEIHTQARLALTTKTAGRVLQLVPSERAPAVGAFPSP